MLARKKQLDRRTTSKTHGIRNECAKRGRKP